MVMVRIRATAAVSEQRLIISSSSKLGFLVANISLVCL